MTDAEKRAHRRLLLGAIAGAILVFTAPRWAVWAAGFIVMPMYWPQIPLEAEAWKTCDPLAPGRTPRQQMVRDVVENVLPGKTRDEIEALLGKSPSHQDMRRYSSLDLEHRKKDANGEWEPFPRTGHGHYYDDHDWDMFYGIGLERYFIFNCDWQVARRRPKFC